MSDPQSEVEGLVERFEEDLDQGVDRKHVLRSAIGRGVDIGVRHATDRMNERFEQLVSRVQHLEEMFDQADRRAQRAISERDSILEEMKLTVTRIEKKLMSGEYRVSIPREDPPA